MTGSDFRNIIAQSGLTQQELAIELGVHRTAIGRQFAAKTVAPLYRLALAGLIASRNYRIIQELSK